MIAIAFGLVPRASAGTDMLIDNSAQAPVAPRPVYNYAPPPVYYAPPPPLIVVHRGFRYCGPGPRFFRYHRPYYARRVFHRFD